MLDLLRDIWSRAQNELRSRAGDAAYDSWLADLRPLALERGICYLEARSRLICERVQRLYQPLIEEVLSAEMGTRIGASLVPAADHGELDDLEVGPTQPILDDSNRSAFLVLQALLEERQLPSKLFLFYGPPGSGKSFSLQWWAQHAPTRPWRFDGPKLVRAFQACLRDGRTDALHAELQTDVPLLLDEVHRLAGHRRIQRELLAILKAREVASSPVLLASRWHPREIWNFEPALASYLVSGFVTRLELPSPRARLTYLRALEGTHAHNGRAQAVESLANRVRGSYADLRRAWLAERRGQASPYFQLIDPRATFQRLRDRVAERFGVEAQAIVGKSQGRHVSLARQVLCYLCVKEGLSRAEVGRYLGGRSRAAVSYATKALEKRMADSVEVRSRVEELL